MRKVPFTKSVILAMLLLLVFALPVFASEQLPTPQSTASVLAIDQTYTEWPAQKDVPVNKVWSIELSSPILASTVNDQNIYVVDSSGQHQNITVTLAADLLKRSKLIPQKITNQERLIHYIFSKHSLQPVQIVSL